MYFIAKYFIYKSQQQKNACWEMMMKTEPQREKQIN